MDMMTLRRNVMSAGNPYKEYTATGNPLTFETNVAKPLKSLAVSWSPSQTGSGDPSPQNVRPIVGMDGANVVHCGKNLLSINRSGPQTTNGIVFNVIKQNNQTVAIHVSGQRTAPNTFFSLNYVNATTMSIPPGTYKTRGETAKIATYVYIINAQGNEQNVYNSTRDDSFTIPEDAKASWIRLQVVTTAEIDEIIYPVLMAVDDVYTTYSVQFPALEKNLLNPADRESGYIASNGTIAPDKTNSLFGYILLKANESYAISTKGTVANIGVCLYELDKTTVISRYNNNNTSSVIISSANTERYLRIWINYDVSTDLSTKTDAEIIQLFAPQVEQGSSATAYEPYTSTVYGGSLDLTTGVLTVEWAKRSLSSFDTFNRTTSYEHEYFYGSFNDRIPGKTTDFMSDIYKKDTVNVFGFNFGNNAVDCSISFSADIGSHNVYIRDDSCATREEFLAMHVNDGVVYKLAEPQTIQLTPTQITALIGDNTVWSDTNGSNTAIYLKR